MRLALIGVTFALVSADITRTCLGTKEAYQSNECCSNPGNIVPGDATELKLIADTLLGDTSGIAAGTWREICELCEYNTTGKTVIMGDSYVHGMRPEAQAAAGGGYPDTAPLEQFGQYVLLGNGGKRYNDGIAALTIDQLVSDTRLFINGDPSRIIINLGRTSSAITLAKARRRTWTFSTSRSRPHEASRKNDGRILFFFCRAYMHELMARPRAFEHGWILSSCHGDRR
jgi:hypothetical protein